MAQFKEYHSFSGSDIRAIFGSQEFGELQMIGYVAERDKALVHTLGSPDARSIARGKRYISGNCVFAVFDRDSLLAAMDEQLRSGVWLGKHETANYRRGGSGVSALTGAGRTAADNGGTAVGSTTTIDAANLNTSSQVLESLTTEARARLADQLLPFDITIVGANEFGHTTKMVIYGVEITSEAGGVSIDDMVIEKQMKFLARSISSWEGLDEWNTTGSTSSAPVNYYNNKASVGRSGNTTSTTTVSSSDSPTSSGYGDTSNTGSGASRTVNYSS